MTLHFGAKLPASNDNAQRQTPDSLQGLHLLVAEDNEMNQFLTRETLARAGCTCDVVADGAAAVEGVTRRYYDAILMDCQMPGMDGLEAARRIRQTESALTGSRRIPIIALTADAIDADRDQCLAAGMDGYLSKPIDAENLFAAIRSLVPPTASVDPPIDVQALFQRSMHDVAFACRTLEQFQLRTLADVELLRLGVSTGDVEGTTRLAQNLKAAAAHVAAAPLRKIALEIELAGARSDLQFAEEQLTRLEEEAKRCADFIPQALSSIARLPRPAAPLIEQR